MKPFYICEACGVYYAHKPDHCRMLMDENVYCSTPIKTAFCAEDLDKEIKELMRKHEHQIEKQIQPYRITLLEGGLSVLRHIEQLINTEEKL